MSGMFLQMAIHTNISVYGVSVDKIR